MLAAKNIGIRNKVHLQDAGQVRLLKRRLRVSDEELRLTVEKVGDSISAVAKEIETRRLTAKLDSERETDTERS
jgi:hypothetical protein